MHGTKVNTKSAGSTLPAPKSLLAPDEHFIGRVDTPYGVHLIKCGEALDHARMRAMQLTSLLLMIHGEDDMEAFKSLRADLQDSLMWMAVQGAREIEQLVELVAGDAQGAAA